MLDPNVEVEIDFTNIDRIKQHFDDPGEDGDFELPVWHETTANMDELYSIESLTKAIDLVHAKRITQVVDREDLYEVSGGELYVCHIIDLEGSTVPGITCTCANGQNRAGRPTCYHSAGVLLVHMKTDLDAFSLDYHL